MKTTETKNLERSLWKYTHSSKGTYGCFEVTLGLSINRDHKEIVDYVSYDTDSIIRCYELKVSYSDFKSSARKSFYGNYNYLVVTEELWQKLQANDDVPIDLGVLIPDKANGLKSVHKGSKHVIGVGDKVMILESMIRSMDREESKLYRLTAEAE